jgi:hypothetical protein
MFSGGFHSSSGALLRAVAMGITPGLSSVGFCSLSFDPSGRIQPVEYDILIGTRPSQRRKLGIPEPTAASSLTELLTRFKVHGYLLKVLIERHEPVCVAVGPPAKAAEPAEFSRAATLAVQGMGQLLGIPVYVVDKALINRYFPGAHFARDIQERLKERVSSTDRRILLAAASAYVAFQLERPNLKGFDQGQLTA